MNAIYNRPFNVYTNSRKYQSDNLASYTLGMFSYLLLLLRKTPVFLSKFQIVTNLTHKEDR